MQTNNPSLVLMTYYMCMCTVVISMYVRYGMVWYGMSFDVVIFWNVLLNVFVCVCVCLKRSVVNREARGNCELQ